MLTLEQKNLEEYMCSQMVMNHRLFLILSKKYISLPIGYLRFLKNRSNVFLRSKDVASKLAEAEDVAKFLETATTKPPSEFRMISWNIDGLDDRNLKMRTKSVVKILQSQRPDIVFLQVTRKSSISFIDCFLMYDAFKSI